LTQKGIAAIPYRKMKLTVTVINVKRQVTKFPPPEEKILAREYYPLPWHS